jgi:hypothetical protein
MSRKRRWHHFSDGGHYNLSELVSTCDERIREGGVSSTAEMNSSVRAMEQFAPQTVVFSPFARKGWGASPFNPHCWQTEGGDPILTEEQLHGAKSDSGSR